MSLGKNLRDKTIVISKRHFLDHELERLFNVVDYFLM